MASHWLLPKTGSDSYEAKNASSYYSTVRGEAGGGVFTFLI
jgi:hypothetical protein